MSFLFSPYGAHGLFFGGRVVGFIPKGTFPSPPATPCPFDQWYITGLYSAIILFPSGKSFGTPAYYKQALGIVAPSPTPPCLGSAFIMAGFGR